MGKIILVLLVCMALAGCMPYRDMAYQFSPYTAADGAKGMQDTYGGTTEELANQTLAFNLGKAGLCPNGWYIEKSWPSPVYAPVTVREIKCK